MVLSMERELADIEHAVAMRYCTVCEEMIRDGDRHEACRIANLEGVLQETQRLVTAGAMTGFNRHDGDWAERLYRNQGSIDRALKQR